MSNTRVFTLDTLLRSISHHDHEIVHIDRNLSRVTDARNVFLDALRARFDTPIDYDLARRHSADFQWLANAIYLGQRADTQRNF